MVMLVCILKDYRKVEEVLLALVEQGVTGATVVEGRGMGQILGSEVPIFAGMRGLFPGSASDSHVVVSVMEATAARACVDLIDRIAGPLSQPGTGIAFTVPLGRVVGLKPPIE
ncbi:MAG: hypothetical protein H6704_00185 [Myxococcales bacterium]|nr:hypothetical protein [Myxococcales bacterium]MCB9534668.1 hypothetical protein [Myxococcales bacterium]